MGSIFWFISVTATKRFSRFFGLARVNAVTIYLSNLWTPPLSRSGKTLGNTIALHELWAAQSVDTLFSSAPLRLPDLVRGLVDALWLREHVRCETAVSPLKAEDADLDRNLVIVGSSARNSVRARYVQAGLPTAIITGENSPGYAGMPMDEVRSITITRGATRSTVNFDDANLALVEKCHDPDRGTTLFSASAPAEIARGQRQSILCGTGNAFRTSLATGIS